MLFKIMEELGTHEGCIEQTCRLFSDRLYGEKEEVPVDDKNRIRLDDWEMEQEVQRRIVELWPRVCTDNLFELTGFAKYQEEFLTLFGFGHSSVDYDAEVDPENPF